MALREALKSGRFVITTDFLPPKGTDIREELKILHPLRGRVDGVNAADNQSAVMSLSSLAASFLIKEEGLEPILQMVCRDRNRLALQSDLLGASALGINNVLVLSGDHQSLGDHPGAKGVFDIESVQLLKAARGLEDGTDMAGNRLKGSPSFCLGAAVNPSSAPLELQIMKMEKKVAAGADFFQTQPVFDIEMFAGFVEKTRHLSVPVLVGVFLLKSAKMAHFMNKNIPGITIPKFILDAFEKSTDPVDTSIEIAARLIRDLRDLSRGVHIYTIHWEDKVPLVLDKAGF
ncbi:MAG: methylenetetrahydrofolate reductase [Alphaproteobacteria bacterium]|uniref:Methylenetetrahydrofolate reductase n=1 Tax=Candidatus Nitrobium versatile TaxID=2884831 RepID=A0A953M0W8_9BACT|nr:methylenetetrahydrofolate reductase [Candidatus Nitrobium versatile]